MREVTITWRKSCMDSIYTGEMSCLLGNSKNSDQAVSTCTHNPCKASPWLMSGFSNLPNHDLGQLQYHKHYDILYRNHYKKENSFYKGHGRLVVNGDWWGFIWHPLRISQNTNEKGVPQLPLAQQALMENLQYVLFLTKMGPISHTQKKKRSQNGSSEGPFSCP